jgi:hypothetical protein
MNKKKFNNIKNSNVDSLYLFKVELDILYSEMKRLKKLYKEIKDHYDHVKKSRSHAALEFISSQTKNLITIKTTIISLIKQSVDIKKIAKDIDIKTKVGDEFKHEALLEKLVDMLQDVKNIEKGKPADNLLEDEFSDEDDIDSKLEGRLEEFQEDEEEPEEEEATIEELGYKVIFDNEKNQYLVDENYEIIEDYEVEPIKVRFKKNKKTKERYAKDKEGNKYEIVDIKELMNK